MQGELECEEGYQKDNGNGSVNIPTCVVMELVAGTPVIKVSIFEKVQLQCYQCLTSVMSFSSSESGWFPKTPTEVLSRCNGPVVQL